MDPPVGFQKPDHASDLRRQVRVNGHGTIASHVTASAPPDLPPGDRPAGAAWLLVSAQGRRVVVATPRGRRAAHGQAETSPDLGRPGLQWIRTYTDNNPRIEIDPKFGALREIRGRPELGPSKTLASVRPVHLPQTLVDLPTEHFDRNLRARFVFTGRDVGLLRRSNFRRHVWFPALEGNKELGWASIQPDMHLPDLRHPHKTRLIEDQASGLAAPAHRPQAEKTTSVSDCTR